MTLSGNALAVPARFGELVLMRRRIFPLLAVGCLLAACVSFRDGPFVLLSGPFLNAVQAKDYQYRQASKSDLRSELGEPAEVRHHDGVEQWAYVSVRRRAGVERRGFMEKVTCWFIKETYVFSFTNERVSSVTTSSESWLATRADDPACVEP